MNFCILTVTACAVFGILASADDINNIAADLDVIAVKNLTDYLIASKENANMNKFVSKLSNIRVARRAITKNLVASEKNVNLHEQNEDD